jgi:type II secretory pathway pseudopilin PulG
VPPKVDPRDWERLFSGRRRRRGPLHTLVTALVGGLLILGLINAAPFVLRQIEISRETARPTQIALQTREARATAQRTATQQSTLTPTPIPSPTATPPPIIGRARVINGGNIRSEPRIAAETVIGQVCVGDQVELLAEETLAGNNRWYRLRVVATANDCAPQRVKAGTEGWVSATLLSQPEP